MGNYVNRLHVVGIITLALLTGGLAVFAWSLRPASGSFPVLETNMTSALTSSVPGGAHLEMTESITHNPDGGGTMILKEPLTNVPQTGRWTADFFALDEGWRLCTPRVLSLEDGSAIEQLEPQYVRTVMSITSTNPAFARPIEIHGSGAFYIKLCWASGGPVQVSGAYLSARFVPVITSLGQSLVLTRLLNLGDGTTADYSIQSAVQPSDPYTVGWKWAVRPVASEPLEVSAVNASETQHDTYRAFLSGILFGVAGGAAVALVQELVAPFRARRELRPPEPGG
jgi:hypothetical protein